MIQYIQHKSTHEIRIRYSEFCNATAEADEVALLETEGDSAMAMCLHHRFCQGAFAHPWLKATGELLLHIIEEARKDAFCQGLRFCKSEKGNG